MSLVYCIQYGGTVNDTRPSQFDIFIGEDGAMTLATRNSWKAEGPKVQRLETDWITVTHETRPKADDVYSIVSLADGWDQSFVGHTWAVEEHAKAWIDIPPAVVPLPAGGLMLAAAVLALAVWRKVR